MPLWPSPWYAMDDTYFRARLRQIIRDRKITTIVETGINEGKSTCQFARLVDRVIGIDIEPDCVRSAERNVAAAGLNNVTLKVGDSPGVLREVMPTLPDETIFFLDAHWLEAWPLLDEIATIPPGKGVIVLHDVKVPDRDFGYDEYKGQPLDYGYVKEALTRWSPTHRVEHNRNADGCRRGLMFIFPDAPREGEATIAEAFPHRRQPVVSIIVAARNDNFMGDYKWRLSTALNFLGRNLAAMGRSDDVEIIICDFNSDVPLHTELPLTQATALITRYVIIPPSLAREMRLEERFPMAVIMNTAIRRAQGEFICMIDGDTFFTLSSLANFFLILEKRLPIGPPADQAFCLFSRRQLPVVHTFRKPTVHELEQYLARNRANLKMDPLIAGLGGPAGGVVANRKLWYEARAYEQSLIWWGWQDLHLHLRMTQRYQWVDLANFGVDLVHLEHYVAARKTNKQMNPTTASPVFEANDPDWGLANHELQVVQPACVVGDDAMYPPQHVPGSVQRWEVTGEQLIAQINAPAVGQLVTRVANECGVPQEELQALLALSWYAQHGRPRVYVEVGLGAGYAAGLVAAACPGIEIYGTENWQPGSSRARDAHPTTTANLVGHYSQFQSYTRFIGGDPATALQRLFQSPHAPETYDLGLLRLDPILGDAMTNAGILAGQLAAGGALVVVGSPERFAAVWQALRQTFPNFTYAQFSPTTGLAIAAALAPTPTRQSAAAAADPSAAIPQTPFSVPTE